MASTNSKLNTPLSEEDCTENSATPSTNYGAGTGIENDDGVRMLENVSYQPSTNFITIKNCAYGLTTANDPAIETKDNIAYGCSNTTHI